MESDGKGLVLAWSLELNLMKLSDKRNIEVVMHCGVGYIKRSVVGGLFWVGRTE